MFVEADPERKTHVTRGYDAAPCGSNERMAAGVVVGECKDSSTT